MDWYTVIPTKDRPAELEQLLYSLRTNQVADPHKILIVNNGKALDTWFHQQAVVIDDVVLPPHIYTMWNVGLAWAERVATGANRPDDWPVPPHAVAVLNDDVVLPPNFAAKMIECLRDTDVTIAFPDQGPGIVNQQPDNGKPMYQSLPQKRITGYAFVVNGTHGIRCDEDFKWWYGDDDLDWQARRDFNGTWEVPGVTVKHLYPSESTNASAVRQEQAARDRETFIKKWGKAPW